MRNALAEVDLSDNRDTLMLFGGVALAIVAAGLILTNKNVRQLLGGFNASDLLQSAAPSFNRYLKLRAM
jgi:hypothetical protein